MLTAQEPSVGLRNCFQKKSAGQIHQSAQVTGLIRIVKWGQNAAGKEPNRLDARQAAEMVVNPQSTLTAPGCYSSLVQSRI